MQDILIKPTLLQSLEILFYSYLAFGDLVHFLRCLSLLHTHLGEKLTLDQTKQRGFYFSKQMFPL